jgi:uncharacterized protein
MKIAVLVLASALAAGAAWAQLSSPVPQGSGAGVHSPNSPIAPLPQRSDVVPWSLLTAVQTKTERNKLLPVFTKEQLALQQKPQRVQGFMMPLEPGERQSHFLLSSVPLTCGFCTPGGPESMVEVKNGGSEDEDAGEVHARPGGGRGEVPDVDGRRVRALLPRRRRRGRQVGWVARRAPQHPSRKGGVPSAAHPTGPGVRAPTPLPPAGTATGHAAGSSSPARTATGPAPAGSRPNAAGAAGSAGTARCTSPRS